MMYLQSSSVNKKPIIAQANTFLGGQIRGCGNCKKTYRYLLYRAGVVAGVEQTQGTNKRSLSPDIK